MGYLRKSLLEIHQALLNNEVTPLELVDEALIKAHKDNNNAFEFIYDKQAYNFLKNLDKYDKNNLLWGIPFIIKDNFSTKDIPTCASSNVLNGYIPSFSSEVYQRLIDCGAIPIGKATLDELAMGGTGTTGHKGNTYNPWDKTHTHQIGGSSCGSAAVCASGIVPFSIGSDTGDSVRKPASNACLVGFKPTWGRISRYGLFPFAPSLDHVAYFTRNVFDASYLLEALAGVDHKDVTSSDKEVLKYSQLLSNPIKGKKIAIIKEIFDDVINNDIKQSFLKTIPQLESMGAVVDFVSIDKRICDAIYTTYMIISSSESTSNNANLDGIKFGKREAGNEYDDIVRNTRNKGFSTRIKRRFILGSYSLYGNNRNEVFLKAQKARRLIVDSFKKVLDEYDAIYLPAVSDIAPLFDQSTYRISSKPSISDNYLAFANLGGFPSITLPLGFSKGLPYGINLTANIFKDDSLLNIAQHLENIIGIKNLSVK